MNNEKVTKEEALEKLDFLLALLETDKAKLKIPTEMRAEMKSLTDSIKDDVIKNRTT